MKRLYFSLAMLGIAGTASAQLGSTQQSAACCQVTNSLAQGVLHPEEETGDERFFTASPVPPNLHILIDTSVSMRELPQVVNSDHREFFASTLNGCANPRLDAYQASRGWNPANVYPVPDTGTGIGSDIGFPGLFQDSRFYGYMSWGDSTSPTPLASTKEQACQMRVPGWSTNPTEYNRCLSCLSTKGYYKVPGATAVNSGDLSNSNFLLWGRFLNFNPPKHVAARAALKRVIADVRAVRPGLSHFLSTAPSSRLLQKQSPTCDKTFPESGAFEPLRDSYIRSINALTFGTTAPLARSLLNIGYYFSSDNSVYSSAFGFGSAYSYPSEYSNPGGVVGSICFACQTNSIILLSDGEPSTDSLSSLIVQQLRGLNGGPVYCPDNAPCGGVTSPRDWGTSLTSYTDDNPDYLLDDVAKLLSTRDLAYNFPGEQRLRIHTIGFGAPNNLLRNAALVGGGSYSVAQDGAELSAALLDRIRDVPAQPATSLASAALSRPDASAAGAVVLPRFKPSRDSSVPWQGFLYRFELVPETLLGCIPGQPWSNGDLDQDGRCESTHLLDANGSLVVEDAQGHFVKREAPGVAAVPFWEAGARLKAGPGPTMRWKTRRLFTVADLNMDRLLDARDTPVEFSEANAPLLAEYLGISQNPGACADLAARLGVPALTQVECARVIIRWYRGADALNPDPALRDDDRPFLLHDIVHASPIIVEPPAPKASCSGASQCQPALFAGQTPMEPDFAGDAYESYVAHAGGRDKVVLVGSNGGMLHAFHNGRRSVDPYSGRLVYDAGTGEELWGFIPPDLLPKLRGALGRHGSFVDGTPMVREVWLDGTGGASADGVKQWREYRTVAVVGTGRGGMHRFALDLTDLLAADLMGNPRVPNQPGSFLWMWPQPCDALLQQVGESLSHFAPQSPPLGPVALTPEADDAFRSMAGQGSGPGILTPWSIHGMPARERWVVALNGGHDPLQMRGRGLALVDLASGRTVWSFFSGDGKGRSHHLRYPISAGVALADVGHAVSSGAVDADLLMDTATVGDYGGQLWTARFWTPGTFDYSTGQVGNWHAARSFRVANLAGRTSDPEALRGPFSSMATTVLQPETGFLRAFVGTGDRQNLAERGGSCRLGNPRACAEQGCGVRNVFKVETPFNRVREDGLHYGGFAQTAASSYPGTSGPSCAGARARFEWSVTSGSMCSVNASGALESTCDGSSSTWACYTSQQGMAPRGSPQGSPTYPERFYGLWSYGGAPWRVFNSEVEAAAFDSRLFTDLDLMNVGQFDTNGMAQPGPVASPLDKGWYVTHATPFERTSTSATVVNGCVLWSAFVLAPSTSACPVAGANLSRLYQADAVSGSASCASGFHAPSGAWARFLQFNSAVSLAEPLSLELQGQASTSLLLNTPSGTSGPGGPGGPVVRIPVTP